MTLMHISLKKKRFLMIWKPKLKLLCNRKKKRPSYHMRLHLIEGCPKIYCSTLINQKIVMISQIWKLSLTKLLHQRNRL